MHKFQNMFVSLSFFTVNQLEEVDDTPLLWLAIHSPTIGYLR